MEALSIVISFAALIVSIASIVVTGIPLYRKFYENKNDIQSMACEGIIRDKTIHITHSYVNMNWQNAVIVKSSIRLDRPKSLSDFTKTNHECFCKSFAPIILREKELSAVRLEYPMSSIGVTDFSDVEISIVTEYVNCQGIRMGDNHKVGTFLKTGIGTWVIGIESIPHKLLNRPTLYSSQL